MTNLARQNGKARVPSRRPLRLPSVDSHFDRFFPAVLSAPIDRTDRLAGTAFMRIDVFESEDNLRLRAEVPGMAPEELQISLTGDRLVLRGEKKKHGAEDGELLHYSECAYGVVERTVELPMEVDADQSTAHFEHGVLTIVLPKAEEHRSRTIDIEVI